MALGKTFSDFLKKDIWIFQAFDANCLRRLGFVSRVLDFFGHDNVSTELTLVVAIVGPNELLRGRLLQCANADTFESEATLAVTDCLLGIFEPLALS